MVDREHFDEFLRDRAVDAGAELVTGTFLRIERDAARHAAWSTATRPRASRAALTDPPGDRRRRRALATSPRPRSRAATRSPMSSPITRSSAPADGGRYDPTRCDVIYDGAISPGLLRLGLSARRAGQRRHGHRRRRHRPEGRDRARCAAPRGLEGCRTIRREGAPIPLKPLDRWDNGRDVVLAGDAAGVVAPSSGEGIYYAMIGGRVAADGGRGLPRHAARRATCALARKLFMKEHKTVFRVLRVDAGRLLQVRRPARALRDRSATTSTCSA